jgi:hypothetical protein
MSYVYNYGFRVRSLHPMTWGILKNVILCSSVQYSYTQCIGINFKQERRAVSWQTPWQKAEITGCRVIRLSGPDKGRRVGEPERSQRLEGWPCPRTHVQPGWKTGGRLADFNSWCRNNVRIPINELCVMCLTDFIDWGYIHSWLVFSTHLTRNVVFISVK